MSIASSVRADKLRVLIVDDEPLARRGVRVRLERMSDLEIVGECSSGSAAVQAIPELRPDLVLLDVQMSEVDGFAVVRALGADRLPLVIFLAAYDEYAIRAFDAQALDYLLKPIDDERFALAIERARRRLRERDSTAATTPRIAVRDRGRTLFIDEQEIDWIGAEGDYVRIHVAGRGHLHRETMSAMQARLDATRFVRIHRSTIVNATRVRELRPCGDREQLVVLRDGTRLRASRGFRDALRALPFQGGQSR
jgi:two-component system LytT family response regulator